MALLRGDNDRACANFQQHVAIHAKIGQELDWAHSRLGHIAISEGNLIEAHQILVETTRNFYNNTNKSGLVSTLEVMASFTFRSGNLSLPPCCSAGQIKLGKN